MLSGNINLLEGMTGTGIYYLTHTKINNGIVRGFVFLQKNKCKNTKVILENLAKRSKKDDMITLKIIQ